MLKPRCSKGARGNGSPRRQKKTERRRLSVSEERSCCVVHSQFCTPVSSTRVCSFAFCCVLLYEYTQEVHYARFISYSKFNLAIVLRRRIMTADNNSTLSLSSHCAAMRHVFQILFAVAFCSCILGTSAVFPSTVDVSCNVHRLQ